MVPQSSALWGGRHGEISGRILAKLQKVFPHDERPSTLKLVGLLGKALKAVKEAHASYEDKLTDCEAYAPHWALPSFTFAEIEMDLLYSVEVLTASVCIDAAGIHPNLRTPAEKQLAKQYMPAYNDIAEGAEVDYIAVTEKGVPHDTWLIHMAAECIRKYRPSGNRPPSGLVVTIARLFEAAVGDFRAQANVQKALKRGRIRKGLLPDRPEEHVPGKPYPLGESKVFFSNLKFLKQKTRRSNPGHPRTSK